MNHQFNGKNQRWQNREFYWVEDAAIQINASMRSCCIWRLATLNSCLCFATILSRSVTTTSCHFLFILQCLPCTQKTKIYLVFYLNRQSMRRNGTVEKDGGLRSGPAREVKEFVIEQCSLWQEWFEVAKHVKMALIIIILPVLNKIEKCLVGEHCSFSTWRRMLDTWAVRDGNVRLVRGVAWWGHAVRRSRSGWSTSGVRWWWCTWAMASWNHVCCWRLTRSRLLTPRPLFTATSPPSPPLQLRYFHHKHLHLIPCTNVWHKATTLYTWL